MKSKDLAGLSVLGESASRTGLYFGSLPLASAEPRFSAYVTGACSGLDRPAEKRVSAHSRNDPFRGLCGGVLCG
jgi:hypothetical protein